MRVLEGWPLVSLDDLPQRLVAADDFHGVVAECGHSKHSTGVVLRTVIDPGGSADLTYRPLAPPIDAACRQFVATWVKGTRYAWGPVQLVLLDRPCYVVVETGVVLLDDERIVAETVYPSTLEETIERQVGGGLGKGTLAAALRRAPVLDSGVWAPLLSRWSSVYFHALAESMVQDTALALLGLSPLIVYPVPTGLLHDCRQIAIDHASSRLERFRAPVVKVPRVVFSTAFYKHVALGTLFREFVARAKREASTTGDARGPGPQKIYVGRLGAAARPMVNEDELIARLREAGFHIFLGQGLPFPQQVQAFRDALLVVGPHGSGLSNVAFAAPAATLFEVRPLNARHRSPLWNESFRSVCAVMGFAYCAHVSANDYDTDAWEANIPEIVSAVATLDPARPPYRIEASE